MGKLKNFVNLLHSKTKRNYVERMFSDKVNCMKVAKQFGKEYWDGERKFGYGGYKYIPGYWSSLAADLIKTYKLGPGSKLLDVGCGKGYLLHELLLLEPDLEVTGYELSHYAIENSSELVRHKIQHQLAEGRYPASAKQFDLVISLGTLHNLELSNVAIALKEITRVGRNSYVMVESYRNEVELFNLQCWALTCQTFLSTSQWIHIFSAHNFNGDYEFIFFEN